ncbi:MAG: DNA alkylation repair protein [Ruminococcaceae bacterium]|nr:DNA alkylation repair protein [Oscillospiraceae bacterium]
MNILNQIKSDLFGMQDAKYKEFHTKLIPTVDKDTIIGVRIPDLRKMAKELSKNEDIDIFLNILPHQYYEENNLHAFIIETEKNYDKCVEKINTFLPFVNNWATCDSMRPKVFSKNTDKLIAEIEKWIKSKKTYTVRFGIECLMTYYLDKEFNEKYIQSVCDIQSEEYYINMMRAWYFATALAKQYDSTVKYIENKKLDTWTHNKTIQKAIESHRITKEQKTYLKTLKRKDN